MRRATLLPAAPLHGPPRLYHHATLLCLTLYHTLLSLYHSLSVARLYACQALSELCHIYASLYHVTKYHHTKFVPRLCAFICAMPSSVPRVYPTSVSCDAMSLLSRLMPVSRTGETDKMLQREEDAESLITLNHSMPRHTTSVAHWVAKEPGKTINRCITVAQMGTVSASCHHSTSNCICGMPCPCHAIICAMYVLLPMRWTDRSCLKLRHSMPRDTLPVPHSVVKEPAKMKAACPSRAQTWIPAGLRQA